MDTVKTGQLIRIKRKEKDMTQQELAERIHVSVSAISKYENGRGFPDISLLIPLSEALDVSIAELLQGETEEKQMKDEENVKEIIQIADEQNKRKLRKRTILLAVCIAFIIISLIGKMLVETWKREYKILTYDECMAPYVKDMNNSIPGYGEWMVDCLMLSYMGYSELYYPLSVDFYTENEKVIIIPVESKWWMMTHKPEPVQIMLTFSRKESDKIKEIWFYNGDMNYEELQQYLHNAELRKDLITDSVKVYERGYER